MALELKRAAYNTAVRAAIAALIDLTDGISAGAEIHFVPADLGDTGNNDHERSTEIGTSAAIKTSYTNRVVHYHVNDGTFPIQIPAGADGRLVPLFWFITNQDNELA